MADRIFVEVRTRLKVANVIVDWAGGPETVLTDGSVLPETISVQADGSVLCVAGNRFHGSGLRFKPRQFTVEKGGSGGVWFRLELEGGVGGRDGQMELLDKPTLYQRYLHDINLGDRSSKS